MRLSRGVLGAFTKYPTTANAKKVSKELYCGLKKFGLFESELDLFAKVADSVGLPVEGHGSSRWWRRHPLVFLVEAGDDICYNILDLEDAFSSEEFSYETTMELLQLLAGSTNRDLSGREKSEIVAYARARNIGSAIDACADAFKENYHSIMDGTFSNSLVETSRRSAEFKQIKEISSERLYTSRRKTELEVLGRNVVHRVLNSSCDVYNELMRLEWKTDCLAGYHEQLCRAIGLDLRDIVDPYSALHSLTDYVSGMTDRYAVRIVKMVSGA